MTDDDAEYTQENFPRICQEPDANVMDASGRPETRKIMSAGVSPAEVASSRQKRSGRVGASDADERDEEIGDNGNFKVNGEDAWEVEKILNKQLGPPVLYLVQWKAPGAPPSWEPHSSLDAARSLVNAFNAHLREASPAPEPKAKPTRKRKAK